jgi:exodeoxyribonuclease-1
MKRVQKTLASKPEFPPAVDVESALYDGFLDDRDKLTCMAVRNNGAEDLRNFRPKVSDSRLTELILHYKAKNFPSSLDEDETRQWEEYRIARLQRQAPKFLAELKDIDTKLAKGETFNGKSEDECRYLAEELKLWYESLQPGDY